MKKGRRNLLVAMVSIQFSIMFVAAQAPQAIPYQAVARNSNGVLIANKQVALRFTLHDATAIGTVVYQETQLVITNTVGLFLVNIGQGTPVSGTFSNINWALNAKFMQVELDTTATQTVFVTIGTQQLMSVPYALNANTATNATNSNYATTAENGVPPGTIEAFAGPVANIPSGWELCDGHAVSTTDPRYVNLFNAIGYAWGNPGGGMFNKPITTGMFLRGQANGTGWDPGRASRGSILTGGNSGDAVGSVQVDAFQGHKHFSGVNTPNNLGTNSVGGTYTSSQTGVLWGSSYSSTYPGVTSNPLSNDNSYGTVRCADETRPLNVYVNYMIKL